MNKNKLLVRNVLKGLFAALSLCFACNSFGQGLSICQGRFPNPITDICWTCIFPISLGAFTIASLGQEDIPNPSDASPLCFCNDPPRVGIKIGFWEPVRIAEITRTPFCMVSMGGLPMNPGIPAPGNGRNTGSKIDTKTSFYQAHWYINPIWYFLETILDAVCLEQGSFDVSYLTEIDPLWNDSTLTMIINPDVALFANPIAQAACAADCASSTAGFPLSELFWCAGCQGSMYPLNGFVGSHIGGAQASYLLTQRMTAKLHRELIAWGSTGIEGLCGTYPQPIMNKRIYKAQMMYPIPQTYGSAGPCCQPFGRTSVIWGAGKEFPIRGEDYTYQIFRKRNCCAF
jgi:conjugal transfer pilus assembly protein TraU